MTCKFPIEGRANSFQLKVLQFPLFQIGTIHFITIPYLYKCLQSVRRSPFMLFENAMRRRCGETLVRLRGQQEETI